MNSTGIGATSDQVQSRGMAMEPLDDLFVIRSRFATDRAQACRENAATAARAASRGTRRSGALGWFGRQLVAAGSAIAGDPPPERRTRATGRT